MENQNNVNSGKGNHDNRESLNGDEESKKDIQNYNNYDSHSEQIPNQTQTVSSNNQQDRSSGINRDYNSRNSSQNLESYPSPGNDNYDEVDEDLEDDDIDDDEELDDDDEMDGNRHDRSYDSETGNTTTEFPRRKGSEFSNNL